MHGTSDNDTTGLQVYIPAAPVRDFLERLKAANLKCDAPPSDNPSASEDAVCAVIGFLEAFPAIRDSGIIRPLQGLLAALPDLLRIATSRNDIVEKLAAANTKLDDPTADASMVRGDALREVIAFFDADDAVLGHGVTRPLKQILAAMHDGRQQQWGNRPTGLADHHLRGVILYVMKEIIRLGVAPAETIRRVAERLEQSGVRNRDGSKIAPDQLLRWQRNPHKQPRITRDVYDALCRERPAEAAQGTDEAVIEGLLAMLGTARNWS